jgi:hypothetical protein
LVLVLAYRFSVDQSAFALLNVQSGKSVCVSPPIIWNFRKTFWLVMEILGKDDSPGECPICGWMQNNLKVVVL